jgi:hypothetical protein
VEHSVSDCAKCGFMQRTDPFARCAEHDVTAEGKPTASAIWRQTMTVADEATARKCRRCKTVITPQNTGRYTNAHRVSDTCDVCDHIIWDDIAWMTGTGRFAQ